MKRNRNAKRYARMFLNAVGMTDAERALGELKTAESLMTGSAEFRKMLVSPVFTSGERTAALKAVGERARFSSQTVKFLGFLADSGAAPALSDVLEKAIAQYLDKKSRVKARVVTPSAVGAAYEARLKSSLKKITNKEVDIEYAIDPSLIGGMLVQVGSTMYDGTLKGQLRLLRDELIRG